jgi:hypothetical protein
MAGAALPRLLRRLRPLEDSRRRAAKVRETLRLEEEEGVVGAGNGDDDDDEG